MDVLGKIGRAFDLRSAVFGALLMGGAVALININHGGRAALTAALKQGVYTFFIAGLILRLCEYLAVHTKKRGRALFIAIAVPTIVTIGATTLMHHLRGTAEPWASVLPTLVLGPPSFAVWALRSRRLRDRSEANREQGDDA